MSEVPLYAGSYDLIGEVSECLSTIFRVKVDDLEPTVRHVKLRKVG